MTLFTVGITAACSSGSASAPVAPAAAAVETIVGLWQTGRGFFTVAEKAGARYIAGGSAWGIVIQHGDEPIAGCKNITSGPNFDLLGDVPITDKGDFEASWTGVAPATNDPLSGTYTHAGVWTVRGHFNSAHSAQGTLEEQTFADNRFHRNNGQILTPCPGITFVFSTAWSASK